MFLGKAIQLTALSAFVSIAGAQQVRSGALGFVLDSDHARVRPLLGVPSAALVGGSLDLGGDVHFLAASPKQDYIIALSGDTRRATLWLRDTEAVYAIAGVPAGATKVVLSPEGSAALFYYADTNQIHVIGGLPASPAPGTDASLTALMNPLNLLAVSDDGALVLASEIASAGHPAPSVVAFGPNGVVGRIALSGSASAVSFLSNSHDALLSGTSETVLIRDAAAQALRVALPSSLNNSVGAIASTDGSRAVFANSESGLVSIVSLSSTAAQPTVVNCNCSPTGIFRTVAKSIYRLNEISAEPISLIDASAAQARMLVIPPVTNHLASPDNQ